MMTDQVGVQDLGGNKDEDEKGEDGGGRYGRLMIGPKKSKKKDVENARQCSLFLYWKANSNTEAVPRMNGYSSVEDNQTAAQWSLSARTYTFGRFNYTRDNAPQICLGGFLICWIREWSRVANGDQADRSETASFLTVWLKTNNLNRAVIKRSSLRAAGLLFLFGFQARIHTVIQQGVVGIKEKRNRIKSKLQLVGGGGRNEKARGLKVCYVCGGWTQTANNFLSSVNYNRIEDIHVQTSFDV